MKLTILLLFLSLLLSKKNAFSQSTFDSSLIDSLYVDAINSRIDLALSSSYKYFEIDNSTIRIKEEIENPIFIFKTTEELIKEAIIQKRSLTIYRITQKIISPDTIDVNFGTISLTAKKGLFLRGGLHFKKANFALSCGGTNGYQADIQYVFDKKHRKWRQIKNIYVLTK